MERRRAIRRFARHFGDLKTYIKSTAYQLEWRSVLYDSDDLVQEASMVLWRVIENYPAAKGTELVKLFKTSFSRHLASVYRRKRIKNDQRNKVTFENLEMGHGSGSDPLTAELNRTRRKIMERTILPWDFFRVRLSKLSERLDRERWRRLVEVPSRINDEYLRRKEASLREIL
jgi:DNA-directed RNA polymerase specialized sigma24 family protein